MLPQYRLVKTPIEMESLYGLKNRVYIWKTLALKKRRATHGMEKTREREPQILFKKKKILVESLTDFLIHTRVEKSRVFTANVERLN